MSDELKRLNTAAFLNNIIELKNDKLFNHSCTLMSLHLFWSVDKAWADAIITSLHYL